MPRKARIDMPSGLHHLIFQGIERKKIFQDDVDRKNLLGRLERALTELAKRIGTSQPAVSYSVQRGEKMARENALDLLPK
jgi:hypothetical protein